MASSEECALARRLKEFVFVENILRRYGCVETDRWPGEEREVAEALLGEVAAPAL